MDYCLVFYSDDPSLNPAEVNNIFQFKYCSKEGK